MHFCAASYASQKKERWEKNLLTNAWMAWDRQMQFSFFLSFSETKSIMLKAFVSRQIIIFNIHSIIPKVMLYAICIVGIKVIETKFVAYGPLYVKKPPKYWSNLGECFQKLPTRHFVPYFFFAWLSASFETWSLQIIFIQ